VPKFFELFDAFKLQEIHRCKKDWIFLYILSQRGGSANIYIFMIYKYFETLIVFYTIIKKLFSVLNQQNW